MHGINKALCQGGNGLTVLNRPLNNLVVNIRNIADIRYRIAASPEPAGHHIKHNHDAGMPNVTKIVHRHAADVHVDLAWKQGGKGLF